jgi:hypothetical protein
VSLSGGRRLFGRCAISCLERSNEGIRVLHGTHVRHIPATQHIHELPRPRAYSLVIFIIFAVAVTITNELAAFEPADAHGAAQCAASRIGKYCRRPERSRWCRRRQLRFAEESLCNPLRFEFGLGRFWSRLREHGVVRDVLLKCLQLAHC